MTAEMMHKTCRVQHKLLDLELKHELDGRTGTYLKSVVRYRSFTAKKGFF
jgi:hypothetical protein